MNIDQNIPQLPPEMIAHISRYLNIKDKLKLRLINKEFKKTFDCLIRLDQLTSISSEYDYFNRNWFYTNRPNKEIDLIKLDDNIILNDLFKNNLFLNVKKLFFQHNGKINLNETINQFKYLEELNIYCELESNSTLSLSKLKILSIYQCFGKRSEKKFVIELETPSLSILRCEDLKYFNFNYPEKIIYFDTTQFEINYNRIDGLFENLEYFILIGIYNIEKLKSIVLNKLNHLKELHFNRKFILEADLIKIKEIYDYKLKSNNLRIFLCGIDYENLKELNTDRFIKESIDFILDNYSKTIDVLPFIDEMNFNKLFKFLNSNPTLSLDNLIYKFPNIKRIWAYELNEENINCFFSYLSKCENLNEFNLNFSIDNQIYYLNQLPDLCKTIEILLLHELTIDESTNLDFIFKFKKLYSLTFGKLYDLNILKSLPDNIKIFDCKLVFKGKTLIIRYFDNKYYCNDLEFYSICDLSKYLDSIV